MDDFFDGASKWASGSIGLHVNSLAHTMAEWLSFKGNLKAIFNGAQDIIIGSFWSQLTGTFHTELDCVLVD